MKLKLFFTAIVLIVFIFAINSSSAIAQKSEYKLQPTDVLYITVHEHPDLETKTRVTADGYITFPLLGEIHVEGLPVQKLEKRLKDLLEKDYLVSAQVLVFIETYHPKQVAVLGEVNKPGKYDLPDEKDMTFLEAIAMAGGFTEDADLGNVKVMRVTKDKEETIRIKVKDITEKGQKDKDIVLEPDDVVVVAESFF